ncbi:MAG: glutamyl-tRNA reductase [Acidimicrobiales bacterium]
MCARWIWLRSCRYWAFTFTGPWAVGTNRRPRDHIRRFRADALRCSRNHHGRDLGPCRRRRSSARLSQTSSVGQAGGVGPPHPGAKRVSLVVIGCNHRSTPLAMLEKVTVAPPDIVKSLHELAHAPHLSEAVLLSTCNRIEVYAYAEKFHGGYSDVREFLARQSGLPPEEVAGHLYCFYDADAVRHLFSVAAGLDSAVVGEHEILGQVRRAWEISRDEGTTGATLGPLFRHSIQVGKRARTETGIARGIASVSQAAVAMAQRELGDLSQRSVLVLGAGEMASGTLRSLVSAGVADLMVANRTWERAVALAGESGGRPVALGELGTALDQVDLLVTTTGAQEIILEHGDIGAVVRRRRGGPLVIIDVAVPRDVDPAAAELPGVSLLDMDDLGEFVGSGLADREREVGRVRSIVDDEVQRYTAITSARAVAPLIARLRNNAEALRMSEIERHQARLGDLDPGQREALESLTKGLVNKLLHQPSVRLKDAAGQARGDRLAEALRDLFDL